VEVVTDVARERSDRVSLCKVFKADAACLLILELGWVVPDVRQRLDHSFFQATALTFIKQGAADEPGDARTEQYHESDHTQHKEGPGDYD